MNDNKEITFDDDSLPLKTIDFEKVIDINVEKHDEVTLGEELYNYSIGSVETLYVPKLTYKLLDKNILIITLAEDKKSISILKGKNC